MNKKISLLLIAVLASAPYQSTYADDLAYIQTRSATIQSEPKLLAKQKKKLSYGDSVSVLSTEGGWTKVKAGGVEGYVHSSALSSRRISLAAEKSVGTGVSDSDISLAGKGFSPEIEKQLASENKSLNFTAVDSMEKLTVSPDQIRSFVSSGKLNQDIF